MNCTIVMRVTDIYVLVGVFVAGGLCGWSLSAFETTRMLKAIMKMERRTDMAVTWTVRVACDVPAPGYAEGNGGKISDGDYWVPFTIEPYAQPPLFSTRAEARAWLAAQPKPPEFRYKDTVIHVRLTVAKWRG